LEAVYSESCPRFGRSDPHTSTSSSGRSLRFGSRLVGPLPDLPYPLFFQVGGGLKIVRFGQAKLMLTFVAAGGENATFNKSTDSYVAIPHPKPAFSPALV